MKIHDECLPCLINQVVKVCHLVNVEDKNKIYQKVFKYLSELDFNKTNPEVIGQTFNMIKQSIGCDDPYLKTRQYYNLEFMQKIPEIEKVINDSSQPFEKAIKYAIVIVLSRTSLEFNYIFNKADVIIAKGQANYESLSEVKNYNIYFMLMSKCKVIAQDIGVKEKSLVCLNHQ